MNVRDMSDNSPFQRNLGLEILRIWMCFEIVCCHWWRDVAEGLFSNVLRRYCSVAVCVFMCLSFFLFGRKLEKIDHVQLLVRGKRILLPSIGWLFPYLAVRAMIWLQQGKSMTGLIREALVHLFFGHSEYINAALWFQMSLFYVTVLFAGVCLIFKRRWKILIGILGILCLISEYTPVHMIWSNTLVSDIATAVGRSFEMIPIATGGVFLALTLPKIEFQTNKSRFVGMIAIYVLLAYLCFMLPTGSGYAYSGIGKALVAILTVVLFSFLPFAGGSDLPWQRIIQTISGHTLGIYCSHNLVGLFYSKSKEFMGCNAGTLLDCVMIFLISLGLCLIISHVFRGKLKKLVC